MPDRLLVNALDRNMRLVGTGDGEALGDGHVQFVGKTYAKLQNVFLDRSEISDPHNLESLLVAL